MPRALPLLLLLMLAPASASADLIVPREDQPCDRKKIGDACDGPAPGTCQQSRCCSRPNISPTVLHYRRKNGVPPGPNDDKETCHDCLKCVATPGADMPPDATPDTAPDMPAPDMPMPAPDMTPAAPDMPAPDMRPAAPPAAAPKGGMCASAPWGGDAGGWSLLAGALLLTTLTRRRRA